MTALTLLTAVLLGASVSDGPGSNAPLEIRSYDLRALTRAHGANADSMSMLPFAWSSSYYFDPGLENEPVVCLSADTIFELARKCVWPSVWDQDGTSLSWSEGRATAVAPAAVQADLERFFAFLAQGLISEQRLVARVYLGHAPAGPSLRPIAEADRALAEAVAAGTLNLDRTCELPVVRGSYEFTSSSVVDQFVYDYDVEIAQGATIADPIVHPLTQGLQVTARVSRGVECSRIDLMMRHSQRLDPSRPVDLGAKAQISNKTVIEDVAQIGTVEMPEVAFSSFASSFHLPDGQAAWIESFLTTPFGEVAVLVDLRVLGRPLPASREYRFSARDSDDVEQSYVLRLLETGTGTLSPVLGPRIGSALFEDFTSDEPTMIAGIDWVTPKFDPDELVNTIQQDSQISLAFDRGDQCFLGYEEGGLLICCAPPEIDAKVRERVEALTGPFVTYSVVGSIDRAGQPKGRFRFPLDEDGPASLWTGVQTTGVFDWDVDVANECMCANPEMRAIVDGMALRLEMFGSPGGGHSLEVESKVRSLIGRPTEFPLRTQTQSSVQKAPAESLVLDEIRSWNPGGSSMRFGDTQLGLELKVERSR